MRITGHELACGGLVGSNSGLKSIITGCSAELVSLTVENSWPGGLVGSSGGTVENSYAVGKIVVTGAGASGLVNETKDGTVTNCYAAVSLTATDQIRGLSNTSSNVINSGFLVGTFKYRGEEYTVESDPSVLTSYLGAGERITPDQLAEKITALDPAASTVKNIPVGAGYAEDYSGNFPYRTGVTDAGGETVHYGLWPVAATEIPLKLVYYEKYQDGTYGVHPSDGTNALKNDPVVSDGYALIIKTEDVNSLPQKVPIKYGENDWQLKRAGKNWMWQSSDEAGDPKFVPVSGDNTLLILPEKIVTGALPDPNQFYQKLVVGGVTYWFNPHFAKTVRSEQPTKPTAVDNCVSVRTPRHLYDLSVYSDTYAPMELYYGQELDLDYNKTYSWGYEMKPTQEGEDGVYLQAPIGKKAENAFTGTYDGGGKKVENVVYDAAKADHYFGLFGYAGGTLQNINYLTGGRTVKAAGEKDIHVGTLAAYVTEITNCTVEVKGSLSMSGSGASMFAGGLAGYAKNMTNCKATVTGNLTISGTQTYAGGLVGYAGPNPAEADPEAEAGVLLTGCRATVGKVTVNGTGNDIFGGGLAGRVADTRMKYIDSEDSSKNVAWPKGVTMSDCHATIESLDVSGPGAYTYGGGLTGYAAQLTECTATIGSSLKVEGTGAFANAYGGGLTGGTGGTSADGSASGVTECSVVAGNAALTVTGEGKQIAERNTDGHPVMGNEVYGGGLVGRTHGKVSGCKAEVTSLEVTGYGVFAYGGGLVGYANKMENCSDISISKVTVTGAGSETNVYGGGLAGQPHYGVANCVIKNSELEVTVTGTGQDVYGGGLVARTFDTVQGSSAEIGALTVTGKKGEGEYKRYVSGSGLTNTAAWVTNCDAIVRTGITVTGGITDTETTGNTNTYTYGAGLVGQPSQAVSTSTALVKALDVKGHGPTTMAGGLVADTAMPLTSCAAGVGTLEVTGTGYETYGGGLAGRASYVKTEDDKPLYGVERCEAGTDSLKVTGPGKTGTYTYAGGLVGYSMGKITNCYAAVDVPRIGSYRGGLVGQLLDTSFKQNLDGIVNSYWLKGDFKYRGETYSMPGNNTNFTDADAKYATTRGELLSKIPEMKSWVNISKPADDFPALGSSGYENWMADYKNQGISGYYPGIVEDRNWQIVHYGLWPIEDKTGRSRNLEYAADPAPLDATLPEPAARPAEPDPKSKDETDPNP